MRKTVVNTVTVQGRLYDHKLKMRTVQNTQSENYGQNFINGSIDIATDEDCLNIVTIHYTYVTPTWKSGKKNGNYDILEKIINGGYGTVLANGKEAAVLLGADTSITVNDFYNQEDQLISAKRIADGFLSVIKTIDPKKSNHFTCDMVINNVQRVEADEERGIENDFVKVKGVIFNNYTKEILPADFVVKSEGGMRYFESLDASGSNLTFTKVWGNLISEKTVRTVEEESEFGDPEIQEFVRVKREYEITGSSKESNKYEIGDAENGITMEELQEKKAEREVKLAGIKARNDEYKAQKAAGATTSNAAPTTTPVNNAGFTF